MGKKAFMAVLLTSVILASFLVGMQAVTMPKANPIPWFANPQMTVAIQSPLNGTRCAQPVLVTFMAQGDSQFSVSDNVTEDYPRSFFYILDGQNMITQGLRFEGTKTTEILGDPVYKYSFSGQTNLTDLTDGFHSITVYYGAVNSIALIGSPSEWIVYNHNLSWQATSQFYVDSTLTPSPTLAPTPSPSPTPTSTLALTASMSESASALNFGNTVNFTVSVEGGNAPFTYAWYIDGDFVENSTSPYYATDSQPVGSHHVYVEVRDASNNTAKTLSPEFNVLPSLTYMPSSSVSPTLQPTTEPTSTPNNTKENFTPALIIVGVVVVIVAVAAGALFYFKKRKRTI